MDLKAKGLQAKEVHLDREWAKDLLAKVVHLQAILVLEDSQVKDRCLLKVTLNKDHQDREALHQDIQGLKDSDLQAKEALLKDKTATCSAILTH